MAEWAEPRGTLGGVRVSTEDEYILILVRTAHLLKKVCGGFATLRGYRRTPSRCWCWCWCWGWVLGARCGVLGARCWVLGAGCWVLCAGCWVLGTGRWVLGAGCWVLGAGCWVLGSEC